MEEELLREERLVLRALLHYSVLGGKLNAELWTPELEVRGEFKYVVVDGKVREAEGWKGVLLVTLGLTEGECAGRGPDRGGGRQGILGPPG